MPTDLEAQLASSEARYARLQAEIDASEKLVEARKKSAEALAHFIACQRLELALEQNAVSGLPLEMWETVLLELPPHHLYKVMQISKQLYELCRSEKIWARVGFLMVWNDPSLSSSARLSIPRDMVLLHKSYKATVDEVIDAVKTGCFGPECGRYRDDEFVLSGIRTNFVGLGVGDDEPMFRVVERLVKDEYNVAGEQQRLIQAGLVPREAETLTMRRRSRRAVSTFVRFLEDEEQLDLEGKLRVKDHVCQLLRNTIFLVDNASQPNRATQQSVHASWLLQDLHPFRDPVTQWMSMWETP